ncbi:MAG: RNA polymerase sigma factor [Prevotella sp.]
MEYINDMTLIARMAIGGDKKAFDQLVRKYQSRVRKFFLAQTLGDSQLSDDLAQDTFIKAYTHIGQFHGTSSFGTWLMRIAYNTYYDYKRRATPIPSLGRGDEVPSNSPLPREGSGVGLRLDILQALSILSDSQRTCITMQLIDGRQIDEIAEITNMPLGTVKSHLKRGKDLMVQFLKSNGY